MSEIHITSILDTCGTCCPMPIFRTNKTMKEMAVGDVLELIATDVGTRVDVPAWCASTGKTILSTSEADGKLHYCIRKDR
jgi:tRNA 2-thiouridine synthesizing protein A